MWNKRGTDSETGRGSDGEKESKMLHPRKAMFVFGVCDRVSISIQVNAFCCMSQTLSRSTSDHSDVDTSFKI